ncbi:MAG: hypothetical protein ACYDBB_11465 [Armatimonadota bacterium]
MTSTSKTKQSTTNVDTLLRYGISSGLTTDQVALMHDTAVRLIAELGVEEEHPALLDFNAETLGYEIIKDTGLRGGFLASYDYAVSDDARRELDALYADAVMRLA